MRAVLLVVAGLALIGFLMIAVVLPRKAGAHAKEAAQALIAGAEPAQEQVGANVEKTSNLPGAGKDIKIPSKSDPRHGEMTWIVSENGTIRGWNKKNALEVTFTPSARGGDVSWTCKGYPAGAMPASCGGRP